MSPATERPSALPVIFDNIPFDLKCEDRWVLWKHDWKADEARWAKVPYQPGGRRAKSSDSATWSCYEDVESAYMFGDFDGIGFVLGDGWNGIDSDDSFVDGKFSTLAQELLDRVAGYAETSPSGTGMKIITRGDLNESKADHALGLEVYYSGRYFAVTGHQLNGHDMVPLETQSLGWVLTEKFNISPIGAAGDDDPLAYYKAPLEDWDIDRVRAELLDTLDPSMGYGDWVNVGMAIFHQFRGYPEGLTLWDEWSKGSDKYSKDYCAEKWRSFTTVRAQGRGSITLATVIKMVGEIKRDEANTARDASLRTHLDAIKSAAEQKTLREIAARVASDSILDKVSKDMIANAMKDRFKAVTGSSVSIAAVRDLIGANRRADKIKTVSANAPDWLQGWVYVTGEAKFFNLDTKERMTREAFDAAFCRFMAPDQDGNIPSAAKVACDGWQIPVVYQTMYVPNLAEIFNINGLECANEYRPSSVPVAADPEAEATKAGFLVLDRHLGLIVPNEEYRRHLKRWMAWVVRNPGLKVLWAPFIKGIEGDGKSVLGSMLAAAMGHENVGVISPEVLSGSNFNDWAAGRCVNVMEEMKLNGHNRHDTYNKVKPLITNLRIEVHGKGKASKTAINTTNYMGFSNHADALPLNKHDRRNFVLFTPFGNQAALHYAIRKTGVSPEQYWNELNDEVIKPRPDIVRAWFEQIDISDFNPNGRAPDTTFKNTMVQLSVSEDELLAAELIEAGCVGVGKEVISSSCLTTAMELSDPPVFISTTKVRALLTKLSYEPVPGTIKWDGKNHRVWVKQGNEYGEQDGAQEDKSKIRALLDATKGEF